MLLDVRHRTSPPHFPAPGSAHTPVQQCTYRHHPCACAYSLTHERTVDGWESVPAAGLAGGKTHGRAGERTGGRTSGWAGGRAGGRVDGQTNLVTRESRSFMCE